MNLIKDFEPIVQITIIICFTILVGIGIKKYFDYLKSFNN